MSAREKSDLPEVAEKRANEAARAAAELVERRGGAKENAELARARGSDAEPGSRVQAQSRLREAVIRNRRDTLTASCIIHRRCFAGELFGLRSLAAPASTRWYMDRVREGLEENLADLRSRVQTGAYRALPSRRTYIPKPDGRQRPLGIASLEDKIVQAAVVAILDADLSRRSSWASVTGSDRSKAISTKRWMRSVRHRQAAHQLGARLRRQSFFDKVSQFSADAFMNIGLAIDVSSG